MAAFSTGSAWIAALAVITAVGVALTLVLATSVIDPPELALDALTVDPAAMRVSGARFWAVKVKLARGADAIAALVLVAAIALLARLMMVVVPA